MKLGFIGAGNMAGAILLGGAHGASVAEIKRRIVAYLKEAGIEP